MKEPGNQSFVTERIAIFIQCPKFIGMGLEVGWRSEGRSIEKMGDCAEREKWQIWNINNIEMSIEIGTQNQVMLRGET